MSDRGGTTRPVYRLGELAERVGARVEGDPELRIRGVATLELAGAEDLAFWTHAKYRDRAAATRAGAVLVAPDTDPGVLGGTARLVHDAPYAALATLVALFHPDPPAALGIAPGAAVAEDASLGERVAIGPNAVVEAGVRLADDVRIGPGAWVGRGVEIGRASVVHGNVSLYPGTVLGERCVVHAGAVLGADGFGFVTVEGAHRKIPQVGRVVVGDDVEIGANTTIDRGALDDTVIGDGTKVDDLVMVAHGVKVGRHCFLVSQSGVAGSTSVGDRVTFAGQSGAAGHLKIGANSTIAAKSAVFADLPEGSFVAGIPAVDHREWKRARAAEKRLPALLAEVRRLRAALDALESSIPHPPSEE